MNEYIVNLVWDRDSCVWIATSEDVPGLVLESGSFDALLERVRFAVPELLELNGYNGQEVLVSYHTQRHERIPCYAGL